MSVSTDNILYGVVQETSQYEAAFFTFNISNDDFYNYEIRTNYYAIACSWLKNREVFASVRPDDASFGNNVDMVRVNFSDHTYSWYKQLG